MKLINSFKLRGILKNLSSEKWDDLKSYGESRSRVQSICADMGTIGKRKPTHS